MRYYRPTVATMCPFINLCRKLCDQLMQTADILLDDRKAQNCCVAHGLVDPSINKYERSQLIFQNSAPG